MLEFAKVALGGLAVAFLVIGGFATPVSASGAGFTTWVAPYHGQSTWWGFDQAHGCHHRVSSLAHMNKSSGAFLVRAAVYAGGCPKTLPGGWSSNVSFESDPIFNSRTLPLGAGTHTIIVNWTIYYNASLAVRSKGVAWAYFLIAPYACISNGFSGYCGPGWPNYGGWGANATSTDTGGKALYYNGTARVSQSFTFTPNSPYTYTLSATVVVDRGVGAGPGSWARASLTDFGNGVHTTLDSIAFR
jgi:hypothetical protein